MSDGDDFLSGTSGTVGGRRDALRLAADAALELEAAASGRRLALARAARRSPPTRRVLVAAIERPERRATLAAALDELGRSRHEVEVATRAVGDAGKFENLNALLADRPPTGCDWLLILDDDVSLPHDFLDRFLCVAERFQLRIAQPAHRRRSHAAWAVTRRRPFSVARETAFVEIGPVTALHRETFQTLLPFPPLRMGWGLDVHWAALAREAGWKLGVVDALAIGHRAAPAGAGYDRAAAIAEARAWLADHPYLPAAEAARTLAVHRRV